MIPIAVLSRGTFHTPTLTSLDDVRPISPNHRLSFLGDKWRHFCLCRHHRTASWSVFPELQPGTQPPHFALLTGLLWRLRRLLSETPYRTVGRFLSEPNLVLSGHRSGLLGLLLGPHVVVYQFSLELTRTCGLAFICVLVSGVHVMHQDAYNSEMAFSHTRSESVMWGSAMGPLGPLAMFGQNLNITQPTSIPSRGGHSQGETTGGSPWESDSGAGFPSPSS